MPDSFPLFAACQPGLEPLLAAELQALGLAGEPRRGGVAWQGSLADGWPRHLDA